METLSIELCERRLVPDSLARTGMRRLIAGRLKDNEQHNGDALDKFLDHASTGPIAQHTADANAQHYEVPATFFQTVLGPHLKYSGCLFEPGAANLEQAEQAMLAITAKRADLRDGQRILDLGCGWGSFALWAAQRYPNAQMFAVSNSNSQRAYIEETARQRGLSNLSAQACDINRYDPGSGVFDRIVSIEMFEHMRNYRELLSRIRNWLTDDGQLFVHIFCHRRHAYPFSNDGDYDWMARHFFSGGIMPSADLLFHFQDDLSVNNHWWMPGTHYQATANAWLTALDANRNDIHALFAETYGQKLAGRQLQRWRMFFMAVEELFGYRDGQEWGIGHYLLEPK